MVSGVEFTYTSTPSVAAENIVDAVAAHRDLHRGSIDIKQAFVTTKRTPEHWHDTAMLLPKDFYVNGKPVGPNCWVLLEKYIYGEDIACKRFVDEIVEIIEGMGCHRSSVHPSVLIRPDIHEDGMMIVVQQIDDFKVFYGKPRAFNQIIIEINKTGRQCTFNTGEIGVYNGVRYTEGIDSKTGGRFFDKDINDWVKNWIQGIESIYDCVIPYQNTPLPNSISVEIAEEAKCEIEDVDLDHVAVMQRIAGGSQWLVRKGM